MLKVCQAVSKLANHYFRMGRIPLQISLLTADREGRSESSDLARSRACCWWALESL